MSKQTAIAIHLLLATLILIPLRYYIQNTDKRDERFAWRMFSSIRSEACISQFMIDDTPVRTSQYFHHAWGQIANRGRIQVIRGMANHLCESNPGKSVRVRVQCEQTPGSTRNNRALLQDRQNVYDSDAVEIVASGVFDFCEIGSL